MASPRNQPTKPNKKAPRAKATPAASTTRTKPTKIEQAEASQAAETTTDTPTRSSTILRRVGRFIIGTSLPEILLLSSLLMARYLKNSDFSYPSEIILPIVIFTVLSTAFYYLFRLILRHRLAAHIAALLLTYALCTYTSSFVWLHHFGDRLIPDSATSFTKALMMLIVMSIVFGLFGFVVDKILRSNNAMRAWPVLKVIVFVACFVFATEVGKVGLRMWTIRHDLAYKQPAISLQQTTSTAAKTGSKPNIYYLLFDRYANATTLKNDYKYDNSPLLDFLNGEGFVTRNDAYANYPFTMESVSSTLAMGYHTQIGKQFQNDAKNFQTAFPYRTILDNPPVAQALKANGYKYNMVSSWWDFTRNVPAANEQPTDSFRLRAFGKNFWLSDLQRDIVNKSFLSPLLLKGLTLGHTAVVKYQLDRNPVQNFYAQMHALKTIAANGASASQPQFTFAHVLSPHDPYIFDQNGNPPTYDSNRTDIGIDETAKYINQLTYLNTQIKDIVQTIRTKDPQAVIVLQADEGPYPKQFRGTLTPTHYYDPITLPVQNMRQKFGVLASYYMPGVSPATVTSNITGSVNSFRFVLDHYLGYNLPSLPDCQFTTGDKYTLYSYQLATGQLKDTTNPADCQQYK